MDSKTAVSQKKENRQKKDPMHAYLCVDVFSLAILQNLYQ